MTITFDEFLQLTKESENFFEFLNNKPYLMPSPSDPHQAISKNLTTLFENFLSNKKCQLREAPYDVFLGDKKHVVCPDICIICDINKITNRGCVGAPDLIIEILSPSSLQRDMHIKHVLYCEYGVKEYWVVIPKFETVNVYILEEDSFYSEVCYEIPDVIYPTVFPDFPVKTEYIFDQISGPERVNYLKEVLDLN